MKHPPRSSPIPTPPPTAAGPPADTWELPAIVGVQARCMFYVVMVRLRDLPRLFTPTDAQAPPEQRAQRGLSKARIPGIARYLLDNPLGYTLPALVAAVDALPTFVPAADKARFGTLRFPRGTAVTALDGQHRLAAIARAMEADRAKRRGGELADESIPVMLFVDVGLERAQQRFADLNRYGVRPNGSLSLLYDHRDPLAEVARTVARKDPVFAQLTDLERTSCADGSPMLFTLAGIHAATRELLGSSDGLPGDAEARAVAFWAAVTAEMRDWRAAAEGQAQPRELRRTFVHAHAVALQAIGRAGGALVRAHPDDWRRRLGPLGTLDWQRSSAAIWEGRALVGGRVSKSAASVLLTANVLKRHLGLELGPEELRLEDAHAQARIALPRVG